MQKLDIRESIISFLKKALPGLPSNFNYEIEIPLDSKMGDLSIHCFNIAKHLKKDPNWVAEDIYLTLGGLEMPFISEIKNTGPYINFFINKEIWFKEICSTILKQKQDYGNINIGKKKTILIEYSAPNTNKPQHLGHLRNNFLGYSLANIFTSIGFNTIKANLVNDRGIHICKSMLAYKLWGENKTPETEKLKPDHFVGKYYVLFEKMVKQNPEFLEQAQQMLEKWEQKDPDIIALWQKMNKWAMCGIRQTYNKVGIDFDKWYFESDIYNLGKKLVMSALKKGLCYKRDDNAIEIDLTKDGLDKKVLIRPDQTSVYVTQDIALASIKQKEYNPYKSIHVTGTEQDYHFKVLFRILEIFGFNWVKNCEHLSYGLIFLPQGKMKSRQGEVVDADDIISEMEQLAKSEILKRDPHMSPLKVSKRAETIALAALKFFLLKFTPQQIINFDPRISISFEGDTGPYLLYTYARINSILQKSKLKPQINNLNIDYSVLKNDTEKELLKLLFIFPQIIEKSFNSYSPSYIAQYVLKLAQKFNEFYHKHRVLDAEKDIKNARLVLIQCVAQVIKKSLSLLGMKVLKQM